MVYKNKLVAVIKVNGQVLRESSDTVTIPFGAEYSILVKNLNSVRAQIKISVDGKDATEGTWLIIRPNEDIELERYIQAGNFERGNRFKFIEMTKEIEGHRGIGAEDGLVRVEYKMERAVVDVPITRYYDDWRPTPRPFPRPPLYPWNRRPDLRRPMHPTRSRAMSASASARPGARSLTRKSSSVPGMDSARDNGITVPGSESNQRFVHGEWFPTEDHSDIIILRLRGTVAGKVVVKPVTVNSKPTCPTCGKVNKGTSQFCATCGTALAVFA